MGFEDADRAVDGFVSAGGDDAGMVRAVLARFAAGDGTEGAQPMCGDLPRCPECPIARHCRYAAEGPRIRQMPEYERPREKLLTRGAEGMSDGEVVALLLGTGRRGRTALDLARELLHRFRGLRGIFAGSAADLAQIAGIGEAKIAQLKAAYEIHRRIGEEPLRPGSSIGDSAAVYNHFRERVKDRREEHFVIFLLDSGNKVIREIEISLGSLNASVVEPREVFRDAVRESAAAIIAAHNHPSGSTTPSPSDLLLTKRLQEVGRIVGIRLLDHIIVADGGYSSMADDGLLDA